MMYEYEYLHDLFNLSTSETDVEGPFGLRPPPGDWATFRNRINELKKRCASGETIKVIYAARHGQAEHNGLSEKYGEPNETVNITHPILDPLLTDLGRQQAEHLSSALRREAARGMPLPEFWFVSPLKRTGETCGIEWAWLFPDVQTYKGDDMGHGVSAVVVENIREHFHVHQCDKRSTLTQLRPLFPSFAYSGLTEDDELWQGGDQRGRETEQELMDRCAKGIDEILRKSDDATYISITSHSGALRGLYAVLGVPPRNLVVGEMNVLVLRVREVD